MKQKLNELKETDNGTGCVKFEGDSDCTQLQEGVGLIDEAIAAIIENGEIGQSYSRTWLSDSCAEKVLKCVKDNQENESSTCIPPDDVDTIEYRLNKYGDYNLEPLDGDKIFGGNGEND